MPWSDWSILIISQVGDRLLTSWLSGLTVNNRTNRSTSGVVTVTWVTPRTRTTFTYRRDQLGRGLVRQGPQWKGMGL